MKYIFDFDDVLFHNTEKLKPHMYNLIEKAGISLSEAKRYYLLARDKGFVMKDFINLLFIDTDSTKTHKKELYENIMKESKNFINENILNIIKNIGKENCYLVTHGVRKYQMEKIERTKTANLFSEIYIVQGSKKEAIEKICEKHPNEDITFVDDKAYHFDNLDFKKYPNLKTILYTGQDLSYLLS